jgi:cell division protein FtsQ
VKRRKRSTVARFRPFWVPIALGGIVALGGLLFAAMWPGFEPRHVVVTGNRRVGRGEILTRAAVASHVSMWLQNTGAMAARIEAIPYVATVQVRRVPPASIRITVSERAPIAIVRSGDEIVLVDHALRVLEPASGGESLPVFVLHRAVDAAPGSFVRLREAAELRDAYDAMAARQMVPVRLEFDRFGGLVVTLRGGLRLLLGSPADFDQKLTLANAIIAQVVGRQRVAAVDLRAPSAPVLVYR